MANCPDPVVLDDQRSRTTHVRSEREDHQGDGPPHALVFIFDELARAGEECVCELTEKIGLDDVLRCQIQSQRTLLT